MKNINYFLQKIISDWQYLKKPSGFVADITSTGEAEHELGDVELYFRNKNHAEVIPYNQKTGYMPLPLLWMNDKSALYYSQVYLRYFIKNYQKIECLDNIELSLPYFKIDFKKLDCVTDEQLRTAKNLIDYVEEYILGIDLVKDKPISIL